jgi:hypothetical protein
MDWRSNSTLGINQFDLYELRSNLLSQRAEYLVSLGFRRKNLLASNSHPTVRPDLSSVHAGDFVLFENILQESVKEFLHKWREYLGSRPESLSNYLVVFYDTYFLIKIMLRRRDLDSIDTYFQVLQSIILLFPEPTLIFKTWSLRNDILIERGCYEEGFSSINSMVKCLENNGYTKSRPQV